MASVRLTRPPHPRSLLDFSSYDPRPPINPPTIPADIYNAFLHPAVPLTIAFLYATTVHYYNSKATGQPYWWSKTKAFKYGVFLHNLGLAVYSLWTFIGMTRVLHGTIIGPNLLSAPAAGRASSVAGTILSFVDSFCKIQDRSASPSPLAGAGLAAQTGHSNFSSSPSHMTIDVSGTELVRPGLWNAGLGYYGWIFYLSKFYEVVDTMIIIAKGKKSSSLQTYHHAGAMVSMWAGIRWMSPPIWIFCWYNSGIHTLMYTYYTLSTINIRVPNKIKRYLTTMQITQFLVGGTGAASHLFIKYRESGENGEYVRCLSHMGQEMAVVINCVYLTPLTYLFVRFFIRSYLSPGKKGAKKVEQVREVNAEGESSGVAKDVVTHAVKRT